MNTQARTRAIKRKLLGLLWLAALTVNAHAADDGWRASFPLYLAAGAYYHSDGVSADTHQAVIASAEMVLSSPAHPYSAGFFVGHLYSGDRGQTGAALAGGLFKHQLRNWDTSVYIVNYDAPDASQRWKFASRVRYRFAARHKLGIEIVGPYRDASASNVMLGYYGTISRSLSVKVVAGSKFKSGQKRVARTELVWQFN